MKLAILLATPLLTAGIADKPVIHELPPAEAQRWIEAAKAEKTEDGATVLEVLEYAQRELPATFKFGKFEIGYGRTDGEPDAVTVETWIGSKLAPADATNIMIPVRRSGSALTVRIPKVAGPFLGGLRKGRKALIGAINQEYQDLCIDQATRAKLC